MQRTFENYSELQSALDKLAIEPGAFRFAPQYGPAAFICSDCKQACALNTEGNGGTGYARTGTNDNDLICYDCASQRERSGLIEKGKGYLYLTGRELTDWTGKFRLPVRHQSKGHHNIARTRYDVWFTGPDGRNWHGTQFGDNTQICHVRRLKA